VRAEEQGLLPEYQKLKDYYASFVFDQDANIKFFRDFLSYREAIKREVRNSSTPVNLFNLNLITENWNFENTSVDETCIFKLKNFDKITILVSKLASIDKHEFKSGLVNLLIQGNMEYNFSDSCAETINNCISRINKSLFVKYINTILSAPSSDTKEWLVKEPYPQITSGGVIILPSSPMTDRFKNVYNFIQTKGDVEIEEGTVKINDNIFYAYLRSQYLTFFNIEESTKSKEPYKANELAIALPKREIISSEILDSLTFYLVSSIIFFLQDKGKQIKEEVLYEILFSDVREMRYFLSNLSKLSQKEGIIVNLYESAKETIKTNPPKVAISTEKSHPKVFHKHESQSRSSKSSKK
jgi:hypothetical protein